MRHSFLPTTEQKKLKREYHIHLVVVGLFFLSGVGLVGSASLFPAYLEVNNEARQQLAMMESLKSDNTRNGVALLEEELRLHSIRMKSVAARNEIAASALIQNAIAARGTVHIDSVSIARTSSTTVTIKMAGKAPTRDSLVSFKARLEKLELGTKVELPISDFAKNKDIVFSLNVIQPIK